MYIYSNSLKYFFKKFVNWERKDNFCKAMILLLVLVMISDSNNGDEDGDNHTNTTAIFSRL